MSEDDEDYVKKMQDIVDELLEQRAKGKISAKTQRDALCGEWP